LAPSLAPLVGPSPPAVLTPNAFVTPKATPAMGQAEILDWDENHRFNKQKRYCYCRESMEPEEPALQCVLCKDWFHPRCIAKLDRPLYHGEYRYFTFSCSMCNAGIEILKEHCRNWVQTGQVALLHMIMTRKQLWFKMREIADFLQTHWSHLCEKHHTKHPRWVCILGNSFSFRKDHVFGRQHNTPFLFLRSEDMGLLKGYWTFKDLETQFPEFKHVELRDNLAMPERFDDGKKKRKEQEKKDVSKVRRDDPDEWEEKRQKVAPNSCTKIESPELEVNELHTHLADSSSCVHGSVVDLATTVDESNSLHRGLDAACADHPAGLPRVSSLSHSTIAPPPLSDGGAG